MGAKRGEPLRFIAEVILAYEGDECLIWPFSRFSSGYGQIRANGKPTGVHRIICEAVHGAPPTPKHEVAHSCGRGQFGCVTKRHVSWKTHAGNMADKLTHGTHNRGTRSPNAKLDPGRVREIRKLLGHMPLAGIARRYDVSCASIKQIAAGKSWGWVE